MERFPRKKLTIVCGHYGTGKTNLAINLAIAASEKGDVTLLDLDVVNPYFRSSDYSEDLKQAGVTVHGPNFANTNLDTPSLSPAIDSALVSDAWVIVDLGGDDVGATAFGRYSGTLSGDYDMLYVINRSRPEVSTPEKAVRVLREIEARAGMKATGIVNNTHLKHLTDAGTIESSMGYADDVARLSGLPLLLTAVPSGLAADFDGVEGILPVDIHVKVPWE